MSRPALSKAESGLKESASPSTYTAPQLRDPEASVKPPFIKQLLQYFCDNWLFILLIVLHAVVVFFNAALIIFNFKRHRFIARDSRTADVTFLAASWLSSAIFKGYLVILLYVTQKLALARLYHVEQTLSQLHEQSAAWLGLASAVVGMWRQLSHHPQGRREVFCILAYLACLFILSSLSASLVNIGYIDTTDPVVGQVVGYLEKVREEQLARALPIVSVLPQADLNLLTYGYAESTVYNIPNLGGLGTTSASAIIFDVVCREVDGLEQVGNASVVARGDGTRSVVYPIHIDPSLKVVGVSPAPGTLNIVSAEPATVGGTAPPTIFIVASGVQIVSDTSDWMTSNASSWVVIEPPLIPDPSTCAHAQGGTGCDPVDRIQVVACDVSANQTTVDVDQSGQLVSEDSFSGSEDQLWTHWTPTVPNPSQAFLSQVGELGRLSPFTNFATNFTLNNGTRIVQASRNSSVLESAVLQYLSIYWTSDGSIFLGDLAYTLQRAVALVYWRAAFDIAIVDPTGGNRNDSNPPGWEVQFNRISPWAGLGVSIILLALGIWLTRPRESTSALSQVNETGVLQLAWLLGRAPDVGAQMADNVTHSNPNLVHLLHAGKSVRLNPRDKLRNSTVSKDQVPLAETEAGTAEQKLRRQGTV